MSYIAPSFPSFKCDGCGRTIQKEDDCVPNGWRLVAVPFDPIANDVEVHACGPVCTIKVLHDVIGRIEAHLARYEGRS